MRQTPTEIPAIPVATNDPRMLLASVTALTEAIEILLARRGDDADRAVTVRDLINAGIVRELVDGLPQDAVINSGGGFVYTGYVHPTYANPTKPTNVKLDSTFTTVFVSFDTAPYYGHSHSEIWRVSDTDGLGVLASAVLRGTTTGSIYYDDVTSGEPYKYFVRHVNKLTPPVHGAWSDTAGHAITASMDPSDIALILEDQLDESALNIDLAARIDLIDVTNGGGLVQGLVDEATDRTAAIAVESGLRQTADDTFYAQYSVKLDVDGYVAGFGLANNGATSEFIIRSDTFAIVQPGGAAGTQSYPFTIGLVNGVSVISMNAQTYIQDATITNLHMANLSVDTAQIRDGAVGMLQIGNVIESTSYTTNDGWRLTQDGGIEASRIIIRDSSGNVILNSGGLGGSIPYEFLNSTDLLNSNTTWQQIAGTTDAPDANATVGANSGNASSDLINSNVTASSIGVADGATATGAEVPNNKTPQGVMSIALIMNSTGVYNAGEIKLTAGDFVLPDGVTVRTLPTDKNINTPWEGGVRPTDGNFYIFWGVGGANARFTSISYLWGSSQSYGIFPATWDGSNWRAYDNNSTGEIFTPLGTDYIIAKGYVAYGDTEITSLSPTISYFEKVTASNVSTFIDSLSVNTLQLAGNSVTVPDTDTNTTSYTGDGSWDTDIAIVSVTTSTAAEILITWSFEQGYSSTTINDSNKWGVRIYDTDASAYVLNRSNMAAITDFPNGTISISKASAGTFQFKMSWLGSGSNINQAKAVITAQAAMK